MIRYTVPTDETFPISAPSSDDGTQDAPNAAAQDANAELYRVRASRLIDPFPDELVIQEKTISVIRRSILSSNVETILVKDIGRVVYLGTPVFAGVEIL